MLSYGLIYRSISDDRCPLTQLSTTVPSAVVADKNIHLGFVCRAIYRYVLLGYKIQLNQEEIKSEMSQSGPKYACHARNVAQRVSPMASKLLANQDTLTLDANRRNQMLSRCRSSYVVCHIFTRRLHPPVPRRQRRVERSQCLPHPTLRSHWGRHAG